MNDAGHRIDRIVICGGGTKNPLLLQEHADALGRDLHLVEEEDAVTLGASLLAAVAARRLRRPARRRRGDGAPGRARRARGRRRAALPRRPSTGCSCSSTTTSSATRRRWRARALTDPAEGDSMLTLTAPRNPHAGARRHRRGAAGHQRRPARVRQHQVLAGAAAVRGQAAGGARRPLRQADAARAPAQGRQGPRLHQHPARGQRRVREPRPRRAADRAAHRLAVLAPPGAARSSTIAARSCCSPTSRAPGRASSACSASPAR